MYIMCLGDIIVHSIIDYGEQHVSHIFDIICVLHYALTPSTLL